MKKMCDSMTFNDVKGQKFPHTLLYHLKLYATKGIKTKKNFEKSNFRKLFLI